MVVALLESKIRIHIQFYLFGKIVHFFRSLFKDSIFPTGYPVHWASYSALSFDLIQGSLPIEKLYS